jgi:hypothetical protein
LPGLLGLLAVGFLTSFFAFANGFTIPFFDTDDFDGLTAFALFFCATDLVNTGFDTKTTFSFTGDSNGFTIPFFAADGLDGLIALALFFFAKDLDNTGFDAGTAFSFAGDSNGATLETSKALAFLGPVFFDPGLFLAPGGRPRLPVFTFTSVLNICCSVGIFAFLPLLAPTL